MRRSRSHDDFTDSDRSVRLCRDYIDYYPPPTPSVPIKKGVKRDRDDEPVEEVRPPLRPQLAYISQVIYAFLSSHRGGDDDRF